METGIASLRERPDTAGIFLDFDGTLSEVVATPGAARALEGVSAVLPRLAERYRVVAIVSGRRAREVASFLGLDPSSGVRCYGLYGLEDLRGTVPGHEDVVDRVEKAMPDVERTASYVPGALVEHKGLHVAVHYRAATDPDAARRVLLERLAPAAASQELRLLEGKRVIELAPGHGPTKGDVVRAVAEAEVLASLLYAGDDVADLDAFAALDAFRDLGAGATKVAVRSDETPDVVLRAADLVVDRPAGLVAVLNRLAE